MDVLRVSATLAIALTLAACGGGGGGNQPPPPPPPPAQTIDLQGVVHKGPFIAGGTVTVSSLGTSGTISQRLLSTTTGSNLGNFSGAITIDQAVLIEANGRFFDEVHDSTITTAISLDAVVQVGSANSQTANVNVLTHLAAQRTLALMANGSTAQSAINQSRDEVLLALEYIATPPQLSVLSTVSLFSAAQDDPDSAYLVTLSALISQRAFDISREFGTDFVSELQFLLDELAQDLADGSADNKAVLNSVRDAAYYIDPDWVMSSLRDLATDNGSSLSAGDISMFLDSDLDGLANNVDTDDDNDGVVDAQDAYPLDWACFLAADGDGAACTIDADIPAVHRADAIEINGDGVVYVLDALRESLQRWSIDRQQYGFTVQVPDDVTAMVYSPAHDLLYLGHDDGRITAMTPTGDHAQNDFADHGSPIRRLVAAGDYLVVIAGNSAYIYSPGGALTGQRTYGFTGDGFAWSRSTNRLFYTPSGWPGDFEYAEIDPANGTFGQDGDTQYSSDFLSVPPLRISPNDAYVVTGAGDFFTIDTLKWQKSLPGEFIDLVIRDDGTIADILPDTAGTRLEYRAANGAVVEYATFSGQPLRVFSRRDRLQVITHEFKPQFHALDIGGDMDGDHVWNYDDDFPDDVAASLDSDNDGRPDRWNDGRSGSDSTTGLAVDAYPLDSICYEPGHGTGTTCNITSNIPFYDPDEFAIDNSDVVYLLDVDNERIYRWDAAQGHHNPLLIGDGDGDLVQMMRFSPDDDRLYIGYDSGKMTYVDTTGPDDEVYFAAMPTTVRGLQPAGNFVWTTGQAALSTEDYGATFDASGAVADRYDNFPDHSRHSAWNDALDRVYFLHGRIQYQTVDQATGTLDTVVDSSTNIATLYFPPVRVSSDQSRVLIGSGEIYDASDLNWLGAIPLGAIDLQWLGQDSTVAAFPDDGDARIERRDGSGRAVEIRTFSGPPVALLPGAGGYILVTDPGSPEFHFYSPSDDSDNDGVDNIDDAFPHDTAASVDTDGDGFPDLWNTGKSGGDSTTGLQIDSYPDDAACWLPQHGDGATCDVTSTIPNYVPASIDIDNAGVVYLYSPENQRVYRWDSVAQQHLNPYLIDFDKGLAGLEPTVVIHHEAHARIYIGYDDGEINYIDLNAGAGQQHLVTMALSVESLGDVGNFLLAEDRNGGGRAHYILDSSGGLRDLDPSNQPSSVYEWNAALGRVFYFREIGSPGDLYFQDIDQTSGQIGAQGHIPTPGGYSIAPPIRISTNASKVLLGSGDIFDATTLDHLGSIPGGFTDAQWTGPDSTVILRDTGDTELERRNDAGEVVEVVPFAGPPLAIRPAGANYLVVTDQGTPAFHFYSSSDDSDGDGAPNSLDAFPLDIAASVDTDGDGYPDNWNSGMSEADSTTGLTLDAYPNDVACWLSAHGDGVTCDITSTMPNYVPENIEMDTSGVVYLFSPENKRIYRWDSVTQQHLNPLVIGSDDWLGETTPELMAYHQGHDRIYLGYANGDINFIDLAAAPDEHYLATTPLAVQAMAYAGNFLLAQDMSGSVATDYVYDAAGTLLDTNAVSYSSGYAWSPSLSRLIFPTSSRPTDLHFQDIDQGTGLIIAEGESPYHGDYPIAPPIRLSVDETKVLVGTGHIFDTVTLTWLDSIPGGGVDIHWYNGDEFVALFDNLGTALIERRDYAGAIVETTTFTGAPLVMLPTGASFLVVTDEGRPAFHEYVPSDDTDGDGVLNTVDAFPLDAAASMDSDHDGYPDEWNPGMTQAESTTGLTLDAYPNDAACYLPGHGDGVNCDVLLTMPSYTPASTHIDDAGVVYLFSPANRRVYRWDSVTQAHLDPLVIGNHIQLGQAEPLTMTYHSAHFRVYVGYDTGDLSYFDLAAGADEQPLAAINGRIVSLSDVGNFLLAQRSGGGPGMHVFDASGTLLDAQDRRGVSPSNDWNPVLGRLYHAQLSGSPKDLFWVDVDQATGIVTGDGESPYHGDYPMSKPVRVSTDGTMVLMGTGHIFNAVHLTWVAALPQSVTDMEWLNDGRIVSIRPNGADTEFETFDGAYQVVSTTTIGNPPLATLKYNDSIVIVTNSPIPSFTVVTP